MGRDEHVAEVSETQHALSSASTITWQEAEQLAREGRATIRRRPIARATSGERLYLESIHPADGVRVLPTGIIYDRQHWRQRLHEIAAVELRAKTSRAA